MSSADFELGCVGLHGPHPAGAHDLQRDVLAERAGEEIDEPVQQAIDVDRLRVERLLAGECQQALGQRRGALRAQHGVLDAARELGLAALGRRLQLPLRVLEIADDDGKQVVEVVRHAAGELADGVHLLRLPQRILRLGAPIHLLMQRFRPPQHDAERDEENERSGHAEDEMRRHGTDPLGADGGGRDAGAQVERRGADPPDPEAAFDVVDRRGGGIEAAGRILRDLAGKTGARVERQQRAGGLRVACQEGSVGAQQRVLQATTVGHAGEEPVERAGQYRCLQHAQKGAVTVQPPADAEEGFAVEAGRVDPLRSRCRHPHRPEP